MEIRQLFYIFRRWLWLIVLCAILAGGTAYLVSRSQTPVYQATSILLVSEGSNNNTSQLNALQTSERLALSYVERLTNREVLAQAVENLGLAINAQDLKKNVAVALVGRTQLVSLSVEHTSPGLARDLANEIPKVFAARNQEQQLARFASSKTSLELELTGLESELAVAEAALAEAERAPAPVRDRAEIDTANDNLLRLRDTYARILQSYEDIRVAEAGNLSNIVIDEAATTPLYAVRPKVLTNTVLAAVLGVMLAVGAVVLIEYLDNTLKTPDDITKLLKLPVVGLFTNMRDITAKGPPYTVRNPRSPFAEAFRGLRTNLAFASVDRPLKTILVTSAGAAEGKTTVAANLAVILAQSNKRVVILDCDLRRPRMHKEFVLSNRAGLSELFLKELQIADVIQQPGNVNELVAITSGSLPPNPAELLASERMRQILEQLTEIADYVVLDSPPLIVSDAAVLSAKVDGVILVVKSGQTDAAAATAALEQFQRSGANVLGVVLNQIPQRSASYYDGYYANEEGYGHILEENKAVKKQGPKRWRRPFSRKSSRVAGDITQQVEGTS